MLRHARLVLFAIVMAMAFALVPPAFADGERETAPGERVAFALSEEGVSASPERGDGYVVSESGGILITAAGEYAFSGAASSGSIVVGSEVTDVTLIFEEGFSLLSVNTAPLLLEKGSQVALVVASGSATLVDAEDSAFDDVKDSGFEGAAIKVKKNASLVLRGPGTLALEGSAKHGIKLGDDAALSLEDGASLSIEAKDDGINANSDLTLSAGSIIVSAGDDAIHSDGDLTVDGASITITNCNEGLEGFNVYLKSGSAEVHAADDGVNAANKNAPNDPHEIVISGGKWFIDAEGDGLDAGGDGITRSSTITVSGGTTVVYGAAGGAGYSTAIDADGGLTHTGGVLVAIDTPNPWVDAPITGSCVVFDGVGLGVGSALSVVDANDVALEGFPQVGVKKSANRVVVLAPNLMTGEPYSLLVGEQEVATARATASYAGHGRSGGTGGSGGSGSAGSGATRLQEPADNAEVPAEEPADKPIDEHAGQAFSDVPEGAWYAAAAQRSAELGLIEGVRQPDGTTRFSGPSTMTRAMVAVVLQRLAGAEGGGVASFADVDDGSWYRDAVAWAASCGLVEGYEDAQGNPTGLFFPNRGATREQFALIVMRFAQMRGEDVSARADLARFPDADRLTYGRQAMEWAVASGLFEGYADGAGLGGTRMLTRAECVTVLLRYIDAFGEEALTSAVV